MLLHKERTLYRNPLPNLFTHSQLADAIPFHFETRFRLKGKREERTNNNSALAFSPSSEARTAFVLTALCFAPASLCGEGGVDGERRRVYHRV